MEPPSTALAHLSDQDYKHGLQTYLRNLFEYLKTDFGFLEVDALQDDVLRFANQTTLIVIKSEYEGPWLALDRYPNPRNEDRGSIPIWAVMTIRDSPNLYSEQVPMIDYFVRWAKELPICATDILNGDFTIEPEVDLWLEQKAEDQKEWTRRRHLDPEIAKANQAFREKDYATVVELLSSLGTALTAAQEKKLSYAQQHLNQT